ncbi:MAG: protein kinase domain-containing protein [Gammaproteobacteria bacterium]
MAVLGGLRTDRLIREILSTEDSRSRQRAVNKLKNLGKAAIARLIVQLGTTRREDADVVQGLLTQLVDRSTLEQYFKGLADPDPRVVTGVTRALSSSSNIDPNRFIDLFDSPEISKSALIRILEAHKSSLDGRKLLRHASKLELSDKVALFRIIDGIADESLVPELINRIDAKDPVMRAHAARVLSRFDGQEVLDGLTGLLSDPDKSVRLAALEGLSSREAINDIAQLCKLLKDQDINIQNKAVDAIIKLNHPRTVQYLLDPLRDDSEYTRRAAVEVLNGIANPNAIRDLLTAIKDVDWWVHTRAADALGTIGGEKVVESVIELIKDDDEFIRRTAVEIINATKDERSYNSLVNALGDSDWWVKERAIDGLAALGNKKAVPILVKMLDREDAGNGQVLIVLMKALSKLGSRAAVKPIIKQLDNPSTVVQKEAVYALEAVTDDGQLGVVAQALSKVAQNGDPQLKELAEDASRRLRQRSAGPTTTSLRMQVPPSDSSMITNGGTVQVPGTIVRGSRPVAAEVIDLAKLQPNDVLGDRYRYIRQVGKGAFGTVVLTEDLMVNEEIILKFLNPQVAADENILKRFVYELRFARKITHPNVIRIFDMISFGSQSAISMEYFASHTLTAEIHSGQTKDIPRSLRLINDICAGMQAAHDTNVVHRDLKPGNILIDDDGVVKVVDFGVAAATRQMDTRLTKTGLLIGTPTYMAPEQVLGREIDTRTDVYALGVIVYEMLTGEPPYSGGDSMAIMYQHVQGKAEPAKVKNPKISSELSGVIQKMMATDPDKRFQSMAELGQHLEAFTA